MSEFFFDYKCIAMGEQIEGKPEDKALDFYLFQNYDVERNTMCVQIYIPQSLQEKYVAAKVYYSLNDVGFPDIFSKCGLKPTVWYCNNKRARRVPEAHFIGTDNSIFINGKDGELYGCGIIAFVEDENEVPKVQNCYKFIINYAKKETISYRIVESKGCIRVQVIYPLIRGGTVKGNKKGIELCIVQKEGAKPVLVQDRQNVVNEFGTDKELTFELKANGRVEDVFKGSFRVEDASKFDYRLAFCDPSYSRHYLLVDESDFTMEDKARRGKERKIKNKISLNAPKCPYCGRTIVPVKKYKKGHTLIVGCNGQVISTSTDDVKLRGKLTVVCSADLKEQSQTKGVDKGYIEVNKLILPDGYADKPSMNLVVAGFPKSGKTIYLSSLFNMQDGGTARGIESFSFILNKIVSVYDKKGKNQKTVEEIKFYNVDDKNGYSLSDSCERTRTSPREDIKKRYVMTVGGDVESQTIKTNVDKLSWHPIGYRLGNLGHAFFYDVPGEMFTRDNTSTVRALDMADCLLAIINGEKKVDDLVGELLTTLERIPYLSKTKIDMENIPIAIVFTKHDLKLTDYSDKAEDAEFCFDENCHVVRENIIDMFPENGVYEGSAIERHIDCSSYELEHYLKARDTGGKFARIKENYKNIKFFTCSALGNDACLGKPVDGKKEVLFKPRRLRIELPIIWLMYKKGLIKR